MADNRMFLIHRPTKLGIMLGKRLGYGWYKAPDQARMDRFFEYLDKSDSEGSQDDFILAMEDCSGSSCFGGWQYTKEKVDGFMKFEFTVNKSFKRSSLRLCR